MRICINPGHHPAYDPGAVGPTGLREADVTTRVAHALLVRLQALAGVEAYAKRQLGGPRTLEELCRRVNASRPAVFISLHCNASPNRQARGPQVYVPEVRGSRSDVRQSRALARLLLTRLPGSESPWSRVIEARFCVLRNVRAVRALVEMDFISHPQVEAMMRTDEWVQAVAAACAQAIEALIRRQVGRRRTP